MTDRHTGSRPAVDPRTPVVVGAAQAVQRVDDPETGMEAVDLMAEAIGLAAEDSGSERILPKVQLVGVVGGRWSYPDPGALLAERIGASGARTLLTNLSGQVVQSLVSHLAGLIRDGELDVAIVVGGETAHTRMLRKRAGLPLEEPSDLPPAPSFGSNAGLSTPYEVERGVALPLVAYPVIESVIRHRRGESHEEHRTRIATLWRGFNQVAQRVPTAWLRDPMTVEEIRDPSPGNRMVSWPYTKVMCAENRVNQASALILCSAERAESLATRRDRWVFPLASAGANEPVLSRRHDLADAPAVRAAGRRALELAGVELGEIGPIDLYSCFPSMVQLTVAALGLDPARPLTVTGGLGFHGGPLANYSGQALAELVHRVRQEGRPGLLHANGGFASKHAVAVYAPHPPAAGFRHEDLQAEVDRLPTRADDRAYEGPVEVEGYTVLHDRSGPTHAVLAGLTPSGARVWGSTTDPSVMDALMREEGCGRPARLDAAGTMELG